MLQAVKISGFDKTPVYLVRGDPYEGGPKLGQLASNWCHLLAQSNMPTMNSLSKWLYNHNSRTRFVERIKLSKEC